MKNIFKQSLILTFFIFMFYYGLTFNDYIAKQVLFSAKIWLKNVVPSLFLSFILIDLLVNSAIPYYLNKYLKINVFYLLSILSGSPSNIYMLKNYNVDYTKIVACCKYPSFIFLYNFLKIIFGKKIAIILIIANILANFLIIKFLKIPKISYHFINRTNIIEVLLKAINRSIPILFNILGTIIFFNILPIYLFKNIYLKSFLFSFLEITNSFINLANANINFWFKIFCTIISLTTCGLCIEFQIKSILKDTNLNYAKYLKYHLIHFILTMVITIVLVL